MRISPSGGLRVKGTQENWSAEPPPPSPRRCPDDSAYAPRVHRLTPRPPPAHSIFFSNLLATAALYCLAYATITFRHRIRQVTMVRREELFSVFQAQALPQSYLVLFRRVVTFVGNVQKVRRKESFTYESRRCRWYRAEIIHCWEVETSSNSGVENNKNSRAEPEEMENGIFPQIPPFKNFGLSRFDEKDCSL